MQTSKIRITPIHDVECACLHWQDVQGVDLVQFAVGDVDEGLDITLQIQ